MASEGHGRLAGKVALITGAGSGIGQASALLFAAEGARVACADLNGAAAEATAATIVGEGGEAIAIQADVREAAAAERMVAATLSRWGRLDVLFNNAGTSRRGSVHTLDEAAWDLTMDTNLKGVYHCSKAAIPRMLEQGGGAIVNTASSFAILVASEAPAYCASKAAVLSLTRQMALDYGPTIRVNAICPGATDTPLVRGNMNRMPDPAARERQLAASNRALKRLAQPREIAQAALFLASDDASFVTGHGLVVDGGQTIATSA